MRNMNKFEIFKKERENIGIEQYRSLPIDAERARLISEDRVIKGYAIVWGVKNSHDEIVLKGATLNSLNARGVGATKNKIAFLKHHRMDTPIAKINVLQEDNYGLYFEAEIIKTPLGDETIEEINAEVLRQLSYGFSYIWDKTEYDSEEDAYILREIKLYEISLVTLSSDENAQLRFADYQKKEILNGIDAQSLRAIKIIVQSELNSRDNHYQNENEHEKEKSNITLF